MNLAGNFRERKIAFIYSWSHAEIPSGKREWGCNFAYNEIKLSRMLNMNSKMFH